MIMYKITSEGYPPKQPILSKLEYIFLEKYFVAETLEEQLKYIRYFNHVAAMRNRLEYGL